MKPSTQNLIVGLLCLIVANTSQHEPSQILFLTASAISVGAMILNLWIEYLDRKKK